MNTKKLAPLISCLCGTNFRSDSRPAGAYPASTHHTPAAMTDQHRAKPEDWEYIRLRAKDGVLLPNCILELCARIEALEAAQQDKLDRLIALDAADPTPDPAMTELRAASAEARPAASEIFPVEYADSNGEGIRIIMEPADETGRVCWVVRNSRRVNPIHEFPTPEAAYAAHQARAEDEANHD